MTLSPRMLASGSFVMCWGLAVLAAPSITSAAPSLLPPFSQTFQDARTDDNQFTGADNKQRWTIDPGADSYQNEFYERPTIQGFNTGGGANTYSAEQYFANLDINTARIGRDTQYFYVEINTVGNYFRKSDGTDDFEGMKYEYGFRFSDDPDGRDGFLMFGTLSNPLLQADWTPANTKGSFDTNADVGGRGTPPNTGLNVTQTDNSAEDDGLDGYDAVVIDAGKVKISGQPENEVLFIRLVGASTIQLALDYVTFGQQLDDAGLHSSFDAAYLDSLQYLDMQAVKGGPKDPANYFWNDKYTFNNAGSPYLDDFNNGIQRPNDVYELDTIRIPEPAWIGLLTLGALVLRRRCRSD